MMTPQIPPTDKQPKKSKHVHPSTSIMNELITTPYEKVIKILLTIKKYISELNSFPKQYLIDLNWVIDIISKHKLYKYEIINQNDLLDKYKELFPEMQHLIQYINNYNEEFKPKPRSRYSNNALLNFNKKQFDLQMPSRNLQRGKHMTVCVGRNTISNSIITDNTNTNGDNTNNTTTNAVNGNSSSNNTFQRESLHFFTNITATPNHNLKLMSSNNITNDNANAIKHIRELASQGMFDNITKVNDSDNESEISEDHLVFDNDDDDNSSKCNTGTNKMHNNSNTSNSNNNNIIQHKFNLLSIENILNTAEYDTKQILSVDFDIFKLKALIDYHNVLPLVGKMIFDYFGFDKNIINITKLNDFLSSISSHYHITVPYHNAIHAADVTQTASLFIINSNIEEIASTNINDILSIIIACLGHDIGHPGYNNTYHMNAMTTIAITYNDVSVLENYHSATLFKVMRDTSCNICEQFSDYDYKILRKRIISQILATDMAKHNQIISIIKSRVDQLTHEGGVVDMNGLINKEGNAASVFDEQEALLDFMVHTADIAHNAKKFEISVQWVELLSNEFWGQGDKEKTMELPVSFLCDREDVDVPKSQIGFIKGFILPSFDLIKMMFNTLDVFYDNASNNLDMWIQLNKDKRKTGFSPEKKGIKKNE